MYSVKPVPNYHNIRKNTLNSNVLDRFIIDNDRLRLCTQLFFKKDK
ncbi:MAG: hypothetical protein ACTSWR_09130 [Candidatus Helarchaeota archaeon]